MLSSRTHIVPDLLSRVAYPVQVILVKRSPLIDHRSTDESIVSLPPHRWGTQAELNLLVEHLFSIGDRVNRELGYATDCILTS